MSIFYAATDDGWLPVGPTQPLRKGTVFHYTNALGLIGVLERNELWASSTLALNDLSEVRYGIKVVKDAVAGRSGRASATLQGMLASDGFGQLTRNSYIVSASRNGDSLSQWVTYAGSLGYAIEFDTQPSLKRVDGVTPGGATEDVVTLPDSAAAATEQWFPVVYDRRKQLELVTGVLDDLDSKNLASPAHLFTPIALCITTFKDSAFESEQEVRYIAGRGTRDSFRPGRYGVVPYAKVASTEETKLPIRSVVIGPLNHDERCSAKATVRSLLDTNGFSHADVTFSNAPYRF